jgi:hypothetical protein
VCANKLNSSVTDAHKATHIHIHTGVCAQYATKISGTYLSSRFFNLLYSYITVCTCCDKLNMQIQVLGLPVTKKVRCLNSKVDWDPEAEVYMLSSFCSALSTGTPFSRTNDNSHLCNTRTVMIHTFERSSLCKKACDTLASSR